MADFTSFLENIDSSIVQLSQNNVMDIEFPTDHNNFFYNQASFPGNLTDNFPDFVDQKVFDHPQPSNENDHSRLNFQDKKRKAVDLLENNSAISSPSGSQNGNHNRRRNSSSRGKGVIKDSEENEKLRDVVHVRARRGQATDSHSLAERVRRGKINDRLKCLQAIVPGCYKTMGMAVMLDEIINYVQSLQNQVEFLSMKLTAASSYYDFNSDVDAVETMQKVKAQEEAKEIDRLMKEAYGVGLSCFHSTWSL
ncbi:hypothetical protein ACFE04_006304 [Oxalis oulophora]